MELLEKSINALDKSTERIKVLMILVSILVIAQVGSFFADYKIRKEHDEQIKHLENRITTLEIQYDLRLDGITKLVSIDLEKTKEIKSFLETSIKKKEKGKKL